LYLFGQEISYPLVEEGSVVVDLYDDTKPNTGEARPPLEEWRLDRENLKRLLKRDTIGWGYTLFLPWGTFRPDVNLVHLKIRYEPSKGTPLYAESGPLTLDNAEVSQRAMLSRPSGGGAKETCGLGRESMPLQGLQANPQVPGKGATGGTPVPLAN
jgi:hypothetical protein